jgi:hypothetical protein
MALSKKHYEQFAYRFDQRRQLIAAVDNGLTQHERDVALEALQGLARTMCIDFALDNANFDRERFLKACGF